MVLATGNAQGELAPLEIGLHCLKAVPPEQGKKGKGLTAYPKKGGKTQPYVSQVRTAAEVVDALHKSTCEVKALVDKARSTVSETPDNPLWKSKQTGSQLRQAAEVALTCPAGRTSAIDKSQHHIYTRQRKRSIKSSLEAPL